MGMAGRDKPRENAAPRRASTGAVRDQKRMLFFLHSLKLHMSLGLMLLAMLSLCLVFTHGLRILPHALTLSFLPRRMNLKATLLLHSSIHPWAAQERERVKALLEIDWRVNQTTRARVLPLQKDGGGQKLPPQIFRAKYSPHRASFQRLLLPWNRPNWHDPRVLGELLLTIKHPIDRHYNVSEEEEGGGGGGGGGAIPKAYGSCAVVGNSGILIKRPQGALIDSHEMVMRLNNARVQGFQHAVGGKTTISFINSNVLHLCSNRPRCLCHPYGDRVPIVSYMCQVVHLLDVALCRSWHKPPLLVTDPRFDDLCMRIAKYYSLKLFLGSSERAVEDWSRAHDGIMFHYSSGMQAVMVALGICKQVGIFGFGKSPDAKHHYHTNQRGELILHDYEAEYAFYRDLVNGSISIPFLDQAGIPIPRVKIFS